MRTRMTLWLVLVALTLKLVPRKAKELYRSPLLTRRERVLLKIATVIGAVCWLIPGPADEIFVVIVVLVLVRKVEARK